MSRPLGNRQLVALKSIGHPGFMIIVGDKVTASLAKRGHVRAEPDGSFVRITSAGLRALADELDAGRIEDPHTAMRRQKEKVA